MEIKQKDGNPTLINKSLICAVTQDIKGWWDGAKFPKEYNLHVKFRGCSDWVELRFENKEELLEVYDAIKKDLESWESQTYH